ncbi:zinc ribbon domain-containing protein [Colwelliaceae bacterium BS250]
MNKTCQSCGMPMKRDPEKGGTNSDGSKSTEYCSLCFQNGKFTQPDITASEMQAFCIVKINECGMPRFLAWLFTRGIPKLRRWS